MYTPSKLDRPSATNLTGKHTWKYQYKDMRFTPYPKYNPNEVPNDEI